MIETMGKHKAPVRKIQAFQRAIWTFYKTNRRDFPWRNTTDPYKILVSEVMLQQTQTSRVETKFEPFLEQFPSVEVLAQASLADVLTAWQGLGYNRRAVALAGAAKMLCENFDGKIPNDQSVLVSLPGIGEATAYAIRAYAFNEPVVFIETNIRRVFIHFFFADKEAVADADIVPLVEYALDRTRPREWYSALMDYGAYLSKITKNPNRKSKHYLKQSRFEGSRRQARGAVLKFLLERGPSTKERIARQIKHRELEAGLADLTQEGIVLKKKRTYAIR